MEYSPEDIKKIKDMHFQGKTIPEIAVALGRTNGAVGMKLHKMKHSGELINPMKFDAADLPPEARLIAAVKQAGFQLVRCDVKAGIYEVEVIQ